MPKASGYVTDGMHGPWQYTTCRPTRTIITCLVSDLTFVGFLLALDCACGYSWLVFYVIRKINIGYLPKSTILFFRLCRVYFSFQYSFQFRHLQPANVDVCYPRLSVFLSSKPDVYNPTNQSENDSGAAMRMNNR